MQPKDLPPNYFVNMFQIQDGAQNEDQNGRQNTFLHTRMGYTDITTVFKTINIQNNQQEMAFRVTIKRFVLKSFN